MTTSKKRMTKAEKKWHELTDGKVLIAKPGKEEEFRKALESTAQIGHGSLGWQGQAEMMVELGLDNMLGLKGSKKRRVKKMREQLIQMFLSSIYDVSEWVTPEVAEKRQVTQKILFDAQK